MADTAANWKGVVSRRSTKRAQRGGLASPSVRRACGGWVWRSAQGLGKLKYGPNEIDATGAPANGPLSVGSEDDCAAQKWLVGPYLVVFDTSAAAA